MVKVLVELSDNVRILDQRYYPVGRVVFQPGWSPFLNRSRKLMRVTREEL
jgi:hypothetical protein